MQKNLHLNTYKLRHPAAFPVKQKHSNEHPKLYYDQHRKLILNE